MDNVFFYFIKSCDENLDFLVQKYSYNKNRPDIMPPECLIEYRKDGIILDVIYEYGDFPWIRVSINGKDNSLDNIVKKNYPEHWVNRKKGPKDANERVDFVLKKYSEVLQKYIEEIFI